MANGNVNEQFKLPGSEGGAFTTELDEAFLSNLDELLRKQETQGIENIGNQLEERGLFRSGQTLKKVTEDVLAPSLARRGEALLGVAKESALRGREERLIGEERKFGVEQGDIAFSRQQQLAKESFDRRLIELERMAEIEERMIRLRDDLEPGFLEQFGAGFAGGLGSGLAGIGTGGLKGVFAGGSKKLAGG